LHTGELVIAHWRASFCTLQWSSDALSLKQMLRKETGFVLLLKQNKTNEILYFMIQLKQIKQHLFFAYSKVGQIHIFLITNRKFNTYVLEEKY